MIEVKLHKPIAHKDNWWYYSWDDEEGVFSLDFVQSLFENNPDEKDFKFNIHCNGGEVEEGLAIYDCLRTSGKNIYMNIEGACHSMAVCMLLAAPKENRTANPNCRALIHKVWTSYAGGTPDDLEAQAEDLRNLQNKILDIYADRTDLPREELETIMAEEKTRSAEDLLNWGFIGKINSYNTNFKPLNKSSMAKNKTLKERVSNFVNEVQKFLGTALNYEFVGEDGEVLFSTEAEDDKLEEGMAATPDGTFELPDGRKVTIADGVITEIEEPQSDPATEDNKTEEELRAENAQLRAKLTEATNLLNEAKKSIKSDYVPGTRVGGATQKNAKSMTAEERRAAIKEKLNHKK